MTFTADSFDQRVELHWSPAEEVSGYTIRRSIGAAPKNPDEGDFVYAGSGWQLVGLDSDRGLQNGITYFYALFPLDHSGKFQEPEIATATPHKMNEPPNLLINPNFQEGYSGWQIEEKGGDYSLTGNGIRMESVANVTSLITQEVTGLKPKTLYTASMQALASSAQMAYVLTIDGDIQQKKQGLGPVQYHYIDQELVGYPKLIRFVFWTDETAAPKVSFSLAGPKVEKAHPEIFVEYSHLALQEGLLPMPQKALDPQHPLVKPMKPLTLPKKGENLVRPQWIFLRAMKQKDQIVLAPSNEFRAEAIQLSPYYLRSGTHTLTALAKVDPGKRAYLSFGDSDQDNLMEITSSEWTKISIPITQEWLQPMITFFAPKKMGNNWFAYLKDIEVKATGEEWLPNAHPYPIMQLDAREWDFTTQKFDPNELLVTPHLNSNPKNLSFSDEGLVFTVDSKKLEGAMIMTRDYFGSGRYDVWLKVGPVMDAMGNVLHGKKPFGCAFPFFTFSYISYLDGQPQWYDAPSPIRNSEIDIETPADAPQDPSICPPDVRWSNGRLNSYGGQIGGLHTDVSRHIQMPDDIDIADGAFHKLSIVWDSGNQMGGDRRTPGTIHWYIDDKLWGSWTGSDYGFDNIPYRCCRLMIGGWFPQNGYGPKNCKDRGWAGTANWDKAKFIVKKMTYTPPIKRPTRDSWQPETDPQQVWNPKFYPK